MQISNDDVDPEILSAFKEELSKAQADSPSVPKGLDAAICAMVDQLKERGFAAEQLIVFIRHACLNVGLSSQLYRSGEWNEKAARNLVDKLVTLCITRYYGQG